MNQTRIIDNFLSRPDYNELRQILFSATFPWFFSEETVTGANDHPQFAHVLYANNRPVSQCIEAFEPFLNTLYASSILRMKVNMTMPSSKEGIVYAWHHDLGWDGDPQQKRTQHVRTAVFYFNDTNGPTVFKGNEPVDCRQNRLVSFPHNTEHSGTTFTDDVRRVVLNVNYLP